MLPRILKIPLLEAFVARIRYSLIESHLAVFLERAQICTRLLFIQTSVPEFQHYRKNQQTVINMWSKYTQSIRDDRDVDITHACG